MSLVPNRASAIASLAASVLLFPLASVSAFSAAPTLKSGMPITFEQNDGQAASDVKFIARGKSGMLFLSSNEIALRAPGKASTFRLKLRGSDANASLLGTGEHTGVANYFLGKDPSAWLTNIPSFSQVTYKNVYPNIDLVVYGTNRQFESDFVIARDADPSTISLEIDGKLNLRQDGSLVVESADGALQLHRPFVYQIASNGERQAVDCHYTISHQNKVSFALGQYDRSKSLVIDPLIDVSTYLGGGVEDAILGIAGDINANVYVVGQTTSPNFPTTPGSLQKPSSPPATAGIPNDPASDCFVAKFSFTGQLIYSTYLGGSALDKCSSVGVNANGEAFVGGTTFSSNFPTKNALYSSLTGAQNGFVAHLDPTGSKLIFSTYLGGGGEYLTATAVDTNSNVYVGGETNSPHYPTTTGAYQATFLGTLSTGAYPHYNNSGFLSKLSADGSKLIYSTYLGAATGDTTINGLAVDFTGSPYVGGETHSVAFPVTPGAYQTTLGSGALENANAFLTKFTTDGTGLVYSTFVGGAIYDSGTAVAVDSLGYAYLTGSTQSPNLPTVKAVQSSLQGTQSAFALKLNTTGSAPVYYTYLGGSNSSTQGAGQGFQIAFGVAVDFFGNAAFVGETTATNFPLASALQPAYGGGVLDAFVTCFSPAGTELFSTYVGGSGDDYGFAILADPYGYFWIAGQTTSPNLTVANAYQPKLAPALGSIAILNGFLTRINYTDISPPPTATLSTTSLSFGNQSVGTVSAPKVITVTNNDPDPLSITAITIAGTNPGDFASTNTCVGKVVAASGGTCTITVTFDPTAAGPRTASLVLTGTAPGSTLTVALSGTGVGAPLVSLSPASLAFANQNTGTTSASQSITLKNTGNAPLNISLITLGGTNPSDFATSNNCGTSVAAGSSCTIAVTFKPTVFGNRTASLVITDNAAGSPQSVPLSGTGLAAIVTLSPTSLTFAGQNTGTASVSQSITLTNSGNIPLLISSLVLGGANPADFTLSNTCGSSVTAGASCTLTVIFKPTATGPRSAQIVISDNAALSPQTIALTGTGTAPIVTLSPTSLNFGSVVIFNSASLTLKISNTGTGLLTIGSIAVRPHVGCSFQITATTCGSTLAAGSSCTVTVAYKPTTLLGETETLNITDNAAGSPQTVTLTGTSKLF